MTFVSAQSLTAGDVYALPASRKRRYTVLAVAVNKPGFVSISRRAQSGEISTVNLLLSRTVAKFIA